MEVAPRLRNVVLAKCRNITDASVYAISRLGKNLHYIHLGHCGQITDEAVKRLVHSCNRIRYIDLGCCTNLTDESIMRLATLPKLKRIGLVKCNQITDESVIALARRHTRARRDAHGNFIGNDYYVSSLERVHLSYCLNLTLKVHFLSLLSLSFLLFPGSRTLLTFGTAEHHPTTKRMSSLDTPEPNGCSSLPQGRVPAVRTRSTAGVY